MEQPLDYQNLAEPKEFDPRLPHNNIDGAWDSKEEYLGFHYRILREDAVAPLRQAVADFKGNYRMSDTHDTTVYTDVHLVGITIESSWSSIPDRILERQSRETHSLGAVKSPYTW
ncbi:hypothetical protein DID88_003021 [Monilinia fructigena]|uniref:Uncharacterized protein n=1 Tax=Monilinia fructigena TaxID=38457 RepID=A0A395IE46_9HELO|nr:hypothetical protein DID88_003021 [Monilinia fructigena]